MDNDIDISPGVLVSPAPFVMYKFLTMDRVRISNSAARQRMAGISELVVLAWK